MPVRGAEEVLGVALGPVIAALGQQPSQLAFTLYDQAVTVVLYFVKPIGRRGLQLAHRATSTR